MGSIPGKAGENRKPAAKETDGFRGIGPLADGPACLAAGRTRNETDPGEAGPKKRMIIGERRIRI